MTTRESAHPVSKKDLEYHLKKVDEHLESIDRGDTQRDNLFELFKGIGSGNKNLISQEVNQTIDTLRYGFSLFYHMSKMLEEKTQEVNEGVSDAEKKTFMNSYGMFAAASYITHEIELQLKESQPIPLDVSKLNFRFSETKDDCLNSILARYYGMMNISKRKGVLENAEDIPRGSYEFFKSLKDQSLTLKETFNPKLVDLVKNSQFRVADKFTISGFESTFEEKTSKAKVEFVPMLPHQVAGNVLAKKEMLRDMDRIALFDLQAKKNPILEVGGLSWSVLYDGLPGTGKSSLFRMGLTRLRERCEQVSDLLGNKNLGRLNWSQIIIDQGVKDEFYGKTGKNLLEKLEPTKKADGIYIITTDDIDLLVTGDRGSTSGGADKDILNILMQYADGINTVIRGNVQWWAATNDAATMDPALRQRFIARYSVDGPQEWYDFADIFHDKLKTWIKSGIVQMEMGKDYTPYEMRKGQTGYESRDADEQISKSKRKGMTLRDIGELSADHKRRNERFTGRAVHAVSEAIKKRINNYEIPEEWYTMPETFFNQPYERRVDMLKELCVKVDGNVIAQEIERYAQSEGRYAADKFESDVSKTMHGIEVHQESIKRLAGKVGGKDEK